MLSIGRRTIQAIATDVGPLYKWLAPQAFSNQVLTQSSGKECRLGSEEEKPFSGMTCCMDFCAHSHYDKHNMADGGATIVSQRIMFSCLFLNFLHLDFFTH